VRLTVVGCAPAWTRRQETASSCYLVEADGRALVLDMGQGAFAALAATREPATVGGVLISHLHADHLVDLVPLRHYLKYEAAAADRIALHGPAELRARFDRFLAEDGFLDGLAGAALEEGEFEVSDFHVQAARVTHIPDSFAFRISLPGRDGPGLVYSGDCGVADDLLPLIEPGDFVLCEAAFGAEAAEGAIHLSAGQAADVARLGGASRLVLTHILDRQDLEAARVLAADRFGGEVLVARPGLQLEVG